MNVFTLTNFPCLKTILFRRNRAEGEHYTRLKARVVEL